jgi:dTDP-glucose 4,6-dehydratase
MKRFLITGGAGFLGSHFVDLCLKNNVKVLNYDAMKKGSMIEHGSNKIHSLYEFKFVDLARDEFDIPDDVDAVVHFAAETHVDRSITDPYSFVESNIMGTYNLINKIKPNMRFHLVSTDEVYGDVINNTKPSIENDSILSSSPYSASKASSEQLVIAWGRTFDMDYTITRGCNTIGSRQNLEKLLPKFVYNASNKIPLPVYGDGKAVRQYIYVTDHINAIYKVVTESKSQEIYNVCSDFSCSINDIVDFIKLYYSDLTITDKENRLGHDLKYYIDNTKIKTILNWNPEFVGEGVLLKAYNDLSYNL